MRLSLASGTSLTQQKLMRMCFKGIHPILKLCVLEKKGGTQLLTILVLRLPVPTDILLAEGVGLIGQIHVYEHPDL